MGMKILCGLMRIPDCKCRHFMVMDGNRYRKIVRHHRVASLVMRCHPIRIRCYRRISVLFIVLDTRQTGIFYSLWPLICEKQNRLFRDWQRWQRSTHWIPMSYDYLLRLTIVDTRSHFSNFRNCRWHSLTLPSHYYLYLLFFQKEIYNCNVGGYVEQICSSWLVVNSVNAVTPQIIPVYNFLIFFWATRISEQPEIAEEGRIFSALHSR